MSRKPILRGKTVENESLYPLNQIPGNIIVKFFGHIVYLISIGKDDLTGDDISIAFANAINGNFHKTPFGLVDVSKGKQAWSIKTVKFEKPFDQKSIRLISGRNNLYHSFPGDVDIDNHKKTGSQIIDIWNERVNLALKNYNDLRTLIVIRSNDLKSFAIFEEDLSQYSSNDYSWGINKDNNFIAKHKSSHKHVFTWQPDGSQFTIHKEVPANVAKFTLKQPEVLSEKERLKELRYNKKWIHFLLDSEDN